MGARAPPSPARSPHAAPPRLPAPPSARPPAACTPGRACRRPAAAGAPGRGLLPRRRPRPPRPAAAAGAGSCGCPSRACWAGRGCGSHTTQRVEWRVWGWRPGHPAASAECRRGEERGGDTGLWARARAAGACRAMGGDPGQAPACRTRLAPLPPPAAAQGSPSGAVGHPRCWRQRAPCRRGGGWGRAGAPRSLQPRHRGQPRSRGCNARSGGGWNRGPPPPHPSDAPPPTPSPRSRPPPAPPSRARGWWCGRPPCAPPAPPRWWWRRWPRLQSWRRSACGSTTSPRSPAPSAPGSARGAATALARQARARAHAWGGRAGGDARSCPSPTHTHAPTHPPTHPPAGRHLRLWHARPKVAQRQRHPPRV